MRKSIFLVPFLLVSLLFLAGCDMIFPPPPPPAESYGAPFDPEAITVDPATGAAIVSNQVIVRFKEGRAKTTIEAVIAGLGCIVVGEISILNVYQLKIPDGADPTDLVAQFANSPHVQWAEANHIIRVDTPAGSTSASEPTDPDFRKQWALHNTGQTGGRVDADIDAPEAWAIEKGHPSVTIAILDTGVNYKHEDLEDNLRMPAGIVFDFIDNDTSPMDEGDPDRHGYGHGTAMTGVAVACMNNKNGDEYVGIAGVAPHATFLPVRVADQGHQVDAIGEEFAVTMGILFAYNRAQVKVISMSFTLSTNPYLLKDAISMLVRNNDVLLVSSAGNDDSPTSMYPAGFPGVMAVAATDHNDQRSDWGERRDWRWWPLPPRWVLVKQASNYGPWVDVSAPGGSSDGHEWEKMIRSTGFPGDKKYGWTGGTSSAAAFVSGVAALIWSLDYRDGDFDLSASEVRDIIEKSADNIDHLNPGFEGRLGAGRVNAHKALLETATKLGLHEPPNVNPPDLTVSSVNLSTSSANPGDNVSVTFTIQNNGDPILGQFQNRLFLSTSQYGGGGQKIPLGDYPMSLGDTESKTQTVEITIPQVSAGDWYVAIYTDCDGAVDETDEYNNINSAAISIESPFGPEPPEVAGKIIDYNASPREVTVPEDVTLSVTIENTGNVSQCSFYPAVDLRRPDGTVERLPIGPITLDPGEQGGTSWTYTIDTQGGWDVMFGLWGESTLETSLDYKGWFDDYIIGRLVESAINIAGTWSGIVTQQSDKRFFYKMVLSQEGTTVSGTSRAEWAEDPQYYKITRIEGTIVDDEFICRDTGILEERPRPGTYWCLITRAVLTFTPGLDVDSLSGPYVCVCEADECLPGEIYLERHE